MKKSYFDSGGNATELIAVLNAISHVSARMARNMTNIRQWKRRFVLMAEPVACFSFMEPIVPVASPVGTFNYKIFLRIICQTLLMLVLWYAPGTLMQSLFCMKMCRIHYRS